MKDECLPILSVFGKLRWLDLEGTAVGVKEVRRWLVKSEVAQRELEGVCPPACVVEWLVSSHSSLIERLSHSPRRGSN